MGQSVCQSRGPGSAGFRGPHRHGIRGRSHSRHTLLPEELASEPCIYGIRGPLRSWNPVWANLHYYVTMAKDSWHARRWRDKLRVWFASPGWRPADVAARFPKPSYDPRRDFVPYYPPRSLALSIYVLVQFAVLMAAHSHFLAVLPSQPLAANVAYFVFLMLGPVTLGGAMEISGWHRAAQARCQPKFRERLTGVPTRVGALRPWRPF